MALQRQVGTWGLLLAAIGGIVGSGWLFGPYYAAQIAGPAALISWVLGGIVMIIIALTFAELSSTFPVAGGSVRFLQFSHGPLAGYTMAWISWISSVAVAPIETLALLRYATSYWPALMHPVQNEFVLTGVGFVIAAILLLILCVINLFGVALLSKTNNAVVLLKLIVPVLAIIVLVSAHFEPQNFVSAGFMPTGWKGVLAALPSGGIILSYIGYSTAIQLAGEAKNPQRALPIAIIGALVFCVILYLLLQTVFIGVLDSGNFASGWGHLTFSNDAGPFAGIALVLGLGWLAKIMYIDAALSPYGTALIYTAATARLSYAFGRNGFLPEWLLHLNKAGVPARLVVLNFVLGLILFMPFPTWQSMMGFLVSCLVFAYAVGPLALIALRVSVPHHPRPFRLPQGKFLCWIAFYLCNLIVFWTGWKIVSKLMIALALGYLVLYLFKNTKRGREIPFYFAESWWLLCYVGILGMTSYLGSFGEGVGVIPFGWDFLVIALVSGVIFELSRIYALESSRAMSEVHRAGFKE